MLKEYEGRKMVNAMTTGENKKPQVGNLVMRMVQEFNRRVEQQLRYSTAFSCRRDSEDTSLEDHGKLSQGDSDDKSHISSSISTNHDIITASDYNLKLQYKQTKIDIRK